MPNVREYRPAQLFARGAAAAGAVLRGAQLAGIQDDVAGTAIAIDPRSTIREVMVYFDGEAEGLPLSSGRVLVRSFTRYAIAPLWPALYVAGVPATPIVPAASPISPPLSLGRLVLRVWSNGEAPPQGLDASKVLSVHQQPVTIGTNASNIELAVCHAHIPGALSVFPWASNDNTPGTGISLKVYAARTEVAAGEAVHLGPGVSSGFGLQVGTLTVPAGADAYAWVTVNNLPPGIGAYSTDWIITALITNATGQRVTCGFRGLFQ